MFRVKCMKNAINTSFASITEREKNTNSISTLVVHLRLERVHNPTEQEKTATEKERNRILHVPHPFWIE